MRVGLYRKLSAKELMLLNCGVGEDPWESFGLQGDPTSSSERRSVLGLHWKDWCWSCNSNTLATWCKELTHLKRPWCWERLKAGGEEDDRGWDGRWHHWLWTWVWASFNNWWRTRKPGVLQSIWLQTVGHDWDWTELNWYFMQYLGMLVLKNYSLFFWDSNLTGHPVFYLACIYGYLLYVWHNINIIHIFLSFIPTFRSLVPGYPALKFLSKSSKCLSHMLPVSYSITQHYFFLFSSASLLSSFARIAQPLHQEVMLILSLPSVLQHLLSTILLLRCL